MALNFSSYSMFPSPIRTEDDFGSLGWERGAESCSNSCWLNWEKSDPFENGGAQDWTDPVDLLPADPFGMELSSNLAAAIVGWFEDLGASSGDCKVYCWDGDYEHDISRWFGEGLFGVSQYGIQDAVCTSPVGTKESLSPKEQEGALPHEGVMLSLGYLGIQDLLSVERVCRSLRAAVQNDPLLWRCVHVDAPLSERITDDALLKLTLRSQGSLQCLSLVGCSRITDEGLRKVLESNPRLRKLSVSGCLRLSMEGIINNLKAFKSSGITGIKQLKLGRLFSVSPEQYEELQMLLGGDDVRVRNSSNRRFFHHGVSSVACEDDRALDIEMCPGCQKVKLVFDCPSQSCQAKGVESCRACDVCIGRCVQCGRCVNDCRFVETFFLDYVCSACWKQAPLKE